MSREIKFRAWNYSQMIYDFKFIDLAAGPGTYTIIKDDTTWANVVLMQYTGLTDKNGREVYDGDILEWKAKGKGKTRHLKVKKHLLVVEWHEQKLRFRGRFITTPDEQYLSLWTMDGHEIVGNIYENPELLTPPSNKE